MPGFPGFWLRNSQLSQTSDGLRSTCGAALLPCYAPSLVRDCLLHPTVHPDWDHRKPFLYVITQLPCAQLHERMSHWCFQMKQRLEGGKHCWIQESLMAHIVALQNVRIQYHLNDVSVLEGSQSPPGDRAFPSSISLQLIKASPCRIYKASHTTQAQEGLADTTDLEKSTRPNLEPDFQVGPWMIPSAVETCRPETGSIFNNFFNMACHKGSDLTSCCEAWISFWKSHQKDIVLSRNLSSGSLSWVELLLYAQIRKTISQELGDNSKPLTSG